MYTVYVGTKAGKIEQLLLFYAQLTQNVYCSFKELRLFFRHPDMAASILMYMSLYYIYVLCRISFSVVNVNKIILNIVQV